MRVLTLIIYFSCLGGVSLPGQVFAQSGLSLQEAENLALARDTLSQGLKQQEQAFIDQSTASQSWPDPRVKFGAQAVPINSFDLEQEPMTQLVVGYQQMLPRGDTLDFAAESMQAMSRMKLAEFQQRQRHVLKQVRQAWFEVALQNESLQILRASRQLFEKMLQISESYYAAGRQQQQDVVQAELEISLVDDRLQQAESALLVAQAKLVKWVGEENLQENIEINQNNLSIKTWPQIQTLTDLLQQHPELTAVNEKIVSQQSKLHMANEQYSPQWGIDINYGYRSGNNPDGSERDDFISAMLSLDLPVFTENKQDRQISAEKKQLLAVKYQQQDVYKQLIKQLQQTSAKLQKLRDRHQLYQRKVLPQARQNAEVALSGYQSGVVSFFTLTRARITELNTRLADLRIKVDFNKSYAELQYLTGDSI